MISPVLRSLNPGVLEWVHLSVGGQAFDRQDLRTVRLDRQNETGANARAVHQNGAGAADPVLTAYVRADQPEVLAKELR